MCDDNLTLALNFLHEVLPNTKGKVADPRLLWGDSLQKFVEEAGRVIHWIKVLDFMFPRGVDFELLGIGHPNGMFYDDETIFGLMFPAPVRKRLPGRVLIINDAVRDHDETPYLTDSETIESWIEQYNETDGEIYYGDTIFFFLDAKAISCFHHGGVFSHTFFGRIDGSRRDFTDASSALSATD